jgi:N-acylneuraminate cytidylyltransferase
MRIIAVIPARGGSKGIPGKNIRMLCDKPLIVHSVEQAKAAKHITDVYVTTDDADIAKAASNAGAKVIMRPASLSGDRASSESALKHVLQSLKAEFDYVVFLQCTSPIRAEDDIDNAIKTIRDKDADSLLSVVQSHKFLWCEKDGQGQSINYDYRNRPRRQDMNIQYMENGSIYIFKPWVLLELDNRLGGDIALYPMAPNSTIDIDDESDFISAELIMQNVKGLKCT